MSDPEMKPDLDFLRVDRRPELGPCFCPVSEEYPHTLKQHDRESCGGVGVPAPCGGCFDCLNAMYYRRSVVG